MQRDPSLDDSLSQLINTIYAAALDDGLWPHVMRQLIRVTDCQAASFCILHGGETPQLPRFESLNFDARHIEEYLDFMVPHDPTIQYLVGHPGARIVHDSSFITEAEKDRHMYYDWHERFSETRHRVVGMIYPAANVQSGITVHRTRRTGDFAPEHLRRFETLFQHIERALQIGFRLGTVGALQQASMDVLDRNPIGILLLDASGKVLFANQAALTLDKAGDGLILTESGVKLRVATDNAQLQKLIAMALRSTSGVVCPPGGAMLAVRSSGKRPLSVLVSPLPAHAFMFTTLHPAVCITVADPERRPLVPLDMLRRLYGLTRSEAALALRLAEGEDLKSAAASLGVSYPTVRTHLAALFRKTGTRRQGELVKLLLTSLPPD